MAIVSMLKIDHRPTVPNLGCSKMSRVPCELLPNCWSVRVVVGKVLDRRRLSVLLQNVPIVLNDPDWNCVFWIKEALASIERDGRVVGTSVLDWQSVRDTAMRYCQRKKDAHRFDGKGEFDMRRPATFDMLEKKETVP